MKKRSDQIVAIMKKRSRAHARSEGGKPPKKRPGRPKKRKAGRPKKKQMTPPFNFDKKQRNDTSSDTSADMKKVLSHDKTVLLKFTTKLSDFTKQQSDLMSSIQKREKDLEKGTNTLNRNFKMMTKIAEACNDVKFHETYKGRHVNDDNLLTPTETKKMLSNLYTIGMGKTTAKKSVLKIKHIQNFGRLLTKGMTSENVTALAREIEAIGFSTVFESFDGGEIPDKKHYERLKKRWSAMDLIFLEENLKSEIEIKTFKEDYITRETALSILRRRSFEETLRDLHKIRKESIDKYRDGLDEIKDKVAFKCSSLGDHAKVFRNSILKLCPPPNVDDLAKYLNNFVIANYLEVLKIRNETEHEEGNRSKRSIFMDSQFSGAAEYYPDVLGRTINFRRTWWKKYGTERRQGFDFVYFPIHHKLHWFLFIVDISLKTVALYDSTREESLKMRCEGESLKVRRDKVKEYKELILGYVKMINQWTMSVHAFSVEEVEPRKYPQQPNMFDCGVYTLMYIHYHTNTFDMMFPAKDIEAFRYFIFLSLYRIRDGKQQEKSSDTDKKLPRRLSPRRTKLTSNS